MHGNEGVGGAGRNIGGGGSGGRDLEVEVVSVAEETESATGLQGGEDEDMGPKKDKVSPQEHIKI